MENKNPICGCIHGHAQTFVNPKVRKAFGLPEMNPEETILQKLEGMKENLTDGNWIKGRYFDSFPRVAEVAAAVLAASAAVTTATALANQSKIDLTNLETNEALAAATASATARDSNLPRLQLWNNRSDYIRNDNGYGKREIHYLLGLFGLTSGFNDDKDTTLLMIHEKLDLAIAFARENNL